MIEAHLAFDEVKDLPALCSDKFFTLLFHFAGCFFDKKYCNSLFAMV